MQRESTVAKQIAHSINRISLPYMRFACECVLSHLLRTFATCNRVQTLKYTKKLCLPTTTRETHSLAYTNRAQEHVGVYFA